MGMRFIQVVIKLLSPRRSGGPSQTQVQFKPISLIRREEGPCTWNMTGGRGLACVGLGSSSELGFEGLFVDGCMTRLSWRWGHRFWPLKYFSCWAVTPLPFLGSPPFSFPLGSPAGCSQGLAE